MPPSSISYKIQMRDEKLLLLYPNLLVSFTDFSWLTFVVTFNFFLLFYAISLRLMENDFPPSHKTSQDEKEGKNCVEMSVKNTKKWKWVGSNISWLRTFQFPFVSMPRILLLIAKGFLAVKNMAQKLSESKAELWRRQNNDAPLVDDEEISWKNES